MYPQCNSFFSSDSIYELSTIIFKPDHYEIRPDAVKYFDSSKMLNSSFDPVQAASLANSIYQDRQMVEFVRLAKGKSSIL